VGAVQAGEKAMMQAFAVGCLVLGLALALWVLFDVFCEPKN